MSNDTIHIAEGCSYELSDKSTVNYSGGGAGEMFTITIKNSSEVKGTIDIMTAADVTFDAALDTNGKITLLKDFIGSADFLTLNLDGYT